MPWCCQITKSIPEFLARVEFSEELISANGGMLHSILTPDSIADPLISVNHSFFK